MCEFTFYIVELLNVVGNIVMFPQLSFYEWLGGKSIPILFSSSLLCFQFEAKKVSNGLSLRLI